MSLKDKIQILIEKITGKHCKYCKHNKGWLCESTKHPACVNSIFPIGWEKKEGVQE